jgi:cytochrome b subunit of formate dehydrogenase
MGEVSGPLAYLLFAWGAVTAVLVVLVIYRTTLSTREDDQLYLNSAEQVMMGTEQQALIAKMNRVGRPIMWLSVLSGILLLATAGVWVWRGFSNS